MTFRSSMVLALLALSGMLTTEAALANTPTADDCATASDNAQPLRKAGKLRATKQQLLVCVSKDCPSIVRDDCAAQLNDVNKAMPTVVFAATDSGGRDLSAVRVKMDGELLGERLDGIPFPVDPGTHEFRFEAAGFATVIKMLVVRETEKERRVPVSFIAHIQGTSSGHDESAASPEQEPGEGDSSPTRWPAYLALGAGAAGLVLGVTYTVFALNQNSTLAGECTLPNGGCDAKYQPQLDILHSDQIVAGIGYGVAVVGAGLGTYLLLTSGSSPPKAHAAPSVRVVPRVGLGWFGVGGQFQ
jgi:microcompartment protein CcmK/EutM